MINIQTIENVADCVPLYLPHSLYLKPMARMKISVALPVNKTGKSISNLDIMDKLTSALKPDKFLVLKVSKSTVDFIRFEAELDDRSHLRNAISRLDGISLKISGFSESFRVRVSEPKDEFPTRHDWDSFFRDAHNMDEMKAGERPDTIHLTHLPIRWFCPRHSEHLDDVKPSESIFKRIFEKYGSIRYVDIPICDPYRNKMNSDINGMKAFSFEHDILFEAYVQFDEYVGFVRVMDEFRGMKLVRKFVDKTQAINISVNFDKSKHLSDAQIQRRERVRQRLISKIKAEEEEIERKKKAELENLERQRKKEEQMKLAEIEKKREREQKRKEKHMRKIQERGQVEISQKIRIEERKLMIAQRKLSSIRVLEAIFERAMLKYKHKYPSHEANKNDLRNRLVERYKEATEKLLKDQKQKVEDIKSKTPLSGLLKVKKSKSSSSEDENDDENKKKLISNAGMINSSVPAVAPNNPFKAVAALAAAGGNTGYTPEVASEWMKSLSMFPYVQPMFSGMPALYRPPTFPGVSLNYRGFAPRIRGRGRGKYRGRGGYDGQSTGYYKHYKNYYETENYEDEDDDGGYHRKSSHYSKSRNRSRTRSRSRSKSYSSRSRSRSRSRKRHYSKRSRTRSSYSRSRTRSSSRSSRTHSRSKTKSRMTRDNNTKSRRSRTRSKTPSNRKLVSTRRSRSLSDWSKASSRSRSRSKHSNARRRRSGSGYRGNGSTDIALETDKLVRSAEVIKRSIENDIKERMREDAREIRKNFHHRNRFPPKMDDDAILPTITSEFDRDETSPDNDRHRSKHNHDDSNDNVEKSKSGYNSSSDAAA